MELTPSRLRRGYGPIYRKLSRCGTEFELAEKVVLLNILERLGQSGRAWPSQERIAEDVGIGVRTVQRALAVLRERGFLRSERRGLGQTNMYELDMEKLLDWAESGVTRTAPEGGTDTTPVAGLMRHPRRDGYPYIEDPQEKTPKRSSPAEEDEPLPLQTDLRQVMDAWTNATGTTVTALVADAMAVALEDLPLDWVLDAIKETGMAGVRHWKYTQAILNRWQQDGREMPPWPVAPPGGGTPPGPMQRALDTRPDQTRDEMLAAGFKPRFKKHTFGSQGGDQ